MKVFAVINEGRLSTDEFNRFLQEVEDVLEDKVLKMFWRTRPRLDSLNTHQPFCAQLDVFYSKSCSTLENVTIFHPEVHISASTAEMKLEAW